MCGRLSLRPAGGQAGIAETCAFLVYKTLLNSTLHNRVLEDVQIEE